MFETVAVSSVWKQWKQGRHSVEHAWISRRLTRHKKADRSFRIMHQNFEDSTNGESQFDFDKNFLFQESQEAVKKRKRQAISTA